MRTNCATARSWLPGRTYRSPSVLIEFQSRGWSSVRRAYFAMAPSSRPWRSSRSAVRSVVSRSIGTTGYWRFLILDSLFVILDFPSGHQELVLDESPIQNHESRMIFDRIKEARLRLERAAMHWRIT